MYCVSHSRSRGMDQWRDESGERGSTRQDASRKRDLIRVRHEIRSTPQRRRRAMLCTIILWFILSLILRKVTYSIATRSRRDSLSTDGQNMRVGVTVSPATTLGPYGHLHCYREPGSRVHLHGSQYRWYLNSITGIVTDELSSMAPSVGLSPLASEFDGASR